MMSTKDLAIRNKLKEIALYKTEYCRNWTELGYCRYGKKCRYAHGDEELRAAPRHNRYKTQQCRAYHLDGACPYGSRCTFIHDASEVMTKRLSASVSCGRQSSAYLPVLSPSLTVSCPSLFFPFGSSTESVWSSKLGLATTNAAEAGSTTTTPCSGAHRPASLVSVSAVGSSSLSTSTSSSSRSSSRNSDYSFNGSARTAGMDDYDLATTTTARHLPRSEPKLLFLPQQEHTLWMM